MRFARRLRTAAAHEQCGKTKSQQAKGGGFRDGADLEVGTEGTGGAIRAVERNIGTLAVEDARIVRIEAGVRIMIGDIGVDQVRDVDREPSQGIAIVERICQKIAADANRCIAVGTLSVGGVVKVNSDGRVHRTGKHVQVQSGAGDWLREVGNKESELGIGIGYFGAKPIVVATVGRAFGHLRGIPPAAAAAGIVIMPERGVIFRRRVDHGRSGSSGQG